MITVHHLEHSRSHRVLWLLEELELPYRLVNYQRDPKVLLAPPELRRVHPLGKSPVLEDDGRVLAESGAILEYLVERYDTSTGSPRRRPRSMARNACATATGCITPKVLRCRRC